MAIQRKETISIVIPAYNEEAVINEFHHRMSNVLDGIDLDGEFVYVNDGSTDKTLDALKNILQSDPRIVVVNLSRNYGKEIALTAGLDMATGDVVVPIDADLQDPPELIPKMIKAWREGADVVYAKRTNRQSESWLK